MLERGVAVSYESIRRLCLKFGPIYAAEIRRRRPQPRDRWHTDEVFIKIGGRTSYLAWKVVSGLGPPEDRILCASARGPAGRAAAYAARRVSSSASRSTNRDRKAHV